MKILLKNWNMKNKFIDIGYPSEWIEEAFNSAFQKTCSELLKKENKKSYLKKVKS